MRLVAIFWVGWRFGLLHIVAKRNPTTWWSWLLWLNAPWWRGSAAVRLRRALEHLGPIFVKFGQMLSTRPDLVRGEYHLQLKRLQDRVIPERSSLIQSVIEKEFNATIAELFREFEHEPLGSASVAQVHGATLKNGSEVIVKVIRPGMDRRIRQDIKTLYRLARTFTHWLPNLDHLNPVEVVAEFERTLEGELDLLREAANASYLRALWKNSERLYVPWVHWEYTTTRVMVQERISGINILDVEGLKKAGVSIPELAKNGVHIFFTQAFEHGYFHADMHPGNIYVHQNGRYCAVDFGIMGTLGLLDKVYLAENLLAFFERDYRKVAEVHLHAGWVAADTRIEEFETAVRTVCEPIFAKPIGEVSFGLLVMRLLQIAHRFKMPVQPQLLLLQKTMMNIEGVGRQLYPELNLWETARPFLRKWLRKQISVTGAAKQFRQEALHFQSMVPQISSYIQRKLKEEEQKQRTRVLPTVARSSFNWRSPIAYLGAAFSTACAAFPSWIQTGLAAQWWWILALFLFSYGLKSQLLDHR